MTKTEEKIVNWVVVCVNEFAYYFSFDVKTAFKHLYNYGGIDFLNEYYEIEHTLSFDEIIEDLRLICKNNGGELS